MSHPLPNLSVNPIYPLLWLLLALWLILIAVIMWRAYRHGAARLPALIGDWRVIRSAPNGPTAEVRQLPEAAPPALPEPPVS